MTSFVTLTNSVTGFVTASESFVTGNGASEASFVTGFVTLRATFVTLSPDVSRETSPPHAVHTDHFAE